MCLQPSCHPEIRLHLAIALVVRACKLGGGLVDVLHGLDQPIGIGLVALASLSVDSGLCILTKAMAFGCCQWCRGWLHGKGRVNQISLNIFKK